MTNISQALQLLEFLIKNGSERVIDDARSHLSLLKMLRQFHFIDINGKDQGVNVRNRSKELTELLSDVDRIRAERKKARTNRNKFGGVQGGGMSGGFSSSNKYGGFGSEDNGTYGGYSGGVYGDGGGYGGNTSGFQDSSSRKDRFEEYDEFDEGGLASPTRRKTDISSASSAKREQKKAAEPPKKREPEIDILGFDDNDVPPMTPPKRLASSEQQAIPNAMDGFGSIQSSAAGGDDDFDDFQSAPPVMQPSNKPSISGLPIPLSSPRATSSVSNLPFTTPKTGSSSSQQAGINDLVGFNSSTSTTSQPTSSFASPSFNIIQSQQGSRPTGYQAAQPNYFTSVPAVTATPAFPSTQQLFSSSSTTTTSNTFSKLGPGASKPLPSTASNGGGDAFGSLWSTASASAGLKKSPNASSGGNNQGPNLASMAKEKASADIWGATSSPPTSSIVRSGAGAGIGGSGSNAKTETGNGLNDLLG